MAYSSARFLMSLSICKRGFSNPEIQRSSTSWMGTAIEIVQAFPTPAYDGDKVGRFRGLRDAGSPTDASCRRRSHSSPRVWPLCPRQPVEQVTPGGVGQRLEDHVPIARVSSVTPHYAGIYLHNVKWQIFPGSRGRSERAALMNPGAGDAAAGVLSGGDRVPAAGAGVGGGAGRVGLRAGEGSPTGPRPIGPESVTGRPTPPGQKWSRWAWVTRSPIGTRRRRSATLRDPVQRLFTRH